MPYAHGMIDADGNALFFEDSYLNHPSNTDPMFMIMRQAPMNYSISEGCPFPDDYYSLNYFKHRGW